MSKKPFKVLFDGKGNLLYYSAGWSAQRTDIKSEDNHVFSDRLIYTKYSDHIFHFKSLISDREYHMFIRNFDEVLRHYKLQSNNIIEGKFTFTKHGTIQGLRMVLPKLVPPPPTP